MIPLILHIKNFLSYGPDIQTINFGPYPLICLSGKNGHGKSALLDAITWAVWGQARKIGGAAKADEGLLRLGQTQMMVSLDFSFNGQTYRVRREFAVTYGKPYAALDFGLLDPITDQITPLTDKTIRGTQEKIETMIGLDFDSFVNSAFLRQGQSNEFSKKSPKERKEILGSIIGLDRFELLKKRAFEKAKNTQQEQDLLLSMQNRMTLELEQSNTISIQLTLLQETLLRLNEQEAAIHQQQLQLAHQKATLAQQQHAADLLAFQLKSKNEQEATQREKLLALRTAWREVHRQQLRAADVQKLEAEKNAVRAALVVHQEGLKKNLALKELLLKSRETEQAIFQQLNAVHVTELNEKKLLVDRLRQEHRAALLRVQEETAQRAELVKEKEQLEAEQKAKIALTPAADFETLVAREEAIFEKRKNYYQRYVAQRTLLKDEASGLSYKQLISPDDKAPNCPLCDQNISAARKRFLKAKFSKQEQFFLHRLQRLVNLITALKEVLTQQHAHLATLRKKREEGQQAQQQGAHLTATLEKILAKLGALGAQQEATATLLETLEKKIAQATQDLGAHQAIQVKDNEQFKNAAQQSAALAQDMAALNYQPHEHEKISHRLAELEQWSAAAEKLKEQVAQQQQRREQIRELVASLKRIKQEMATLLEQIKQFDPVATTQKNIALAEQQLAQAVQQCAQEKEKTFQEKGSLENQRQKLILMEQELGSLKKKQAVLAEIAEEYVAIAAALGKDGIQALLIEDTIPEIEHEANQLLGKLTDNQAHVFIESLRDLKKGGTKETLDIKISDPMGIRPYELFSGGEAFRIDFALRIAISKLLARRAGTSLQTLIIDEGFGSQDEDGLAHIMEALYKIQDDFAKIIIVSHLPSMKDQFPVHFVIDKGAHGSKIQVMEQG